MWASSLSPSWEWSILSICRCRGNPVRSLAMSPRGCEDVLGSVYSEVAGIPISWLGFAFYLVEFGASVFAVFGGTEPLRLLFWPATAAFLVSAILTGVQIFVLEAYCEYCLHLGRSLDGNISSRVAWLEIPERLRERRKKMSFSHDFGRILEQPIAEVCRAEEERLNPCRDDN